MAFLIGGANSAADTGFSVANSCRFDSGSSAYLSRTLGTPSAAKKFSISFWVKKNRNGSHEYMFGTDGGNEEVWMRFNDADQLHWFAQDSGGSTIEELKTNAVYRAPSAWYHVLFIHDTSGGTAGDYTQFWVNGTRVTSFATQTNQAQDAAVRWNTAVEHFIGRRNSSGSYADVYLAEVVLTDNTALASTDVGEFNSDSPTIWQPIDVSGLTFGTNGAYFDFEDAANLGNDANG